MLTPREIPAVAEETLITPPLTPRVITAVVWSSSPVMPATSPTASSSCVSWLFMLSTVTCVLPRSGTTCPETSLIDCSVVELTQRFWAGGAQVDLSQLESHDPAYLARVRAKSEKAGLWLESSVPLKYLESPDAYALTGGSRRRSASTAFAWRCCTAALRELCDAGRLGRARSQVAEPAHRDQACGRSVSYSRRASRTTRTTRLRELAGMLTSLGSEKIGACVDFGNNISLLEDLLDTILTLAPFAVTTHLKDMAVRPSPDGFELSEVPLGQGIVPLAEAIRAREGCAARAPAGR